MRSVASDERAGGCASAASAAPAGGRPRACPRSRRSTRTSASDGGGRDRGSALPERLTRLARRRSAARPTSTATATCRLELQTTCARELRDEIRPRSRPGLRRAASSTSCPILDVADRARVDAEVGDRLGAERLDEIDARVDRRQVRPLGRRMDELAAQSGDDRAAVVAAYPRDTPRAPGPGPRTSFRRARC